MRGRLLVAAVAVLMLPLGFVPPAAANNHTVALTPTDDTYTFPEAPDWDRGDHPRAESSAYPRINSTAWLRFDLSDVPEGAALQSATLEMATAWSNRESIDLHIAATDWTEAMTHRTAIDYGERVASASASRSIVALDVTSVTAAAGQAIAFAIPPPNSERVGYHFHTSESAQPPLLRLSWNADSKDTVEQSSGRGTLFGATIYHVGQNFREGLAASDANFGRMGAVRVFYPGAPSAWPGNAGYADRPVVVSFKLPMQEVLTGRHDSRLRQWFADAPTDRPIWWSLHHEPEDDIERSSFTASQYRSAWQRISGFADEANNSQLKATLILMDWTLDPRSGRDWRDYYPGNQWIDTIAFDAYNPPFWDGYIDPERILDRIAKLSNELGKPFGLGEFGSKLMNGDKGNGRAAWLKDFAETAEELGAEFVLYWDASDGPGSDYRLLDEPSIKAWREVVSGLAG